MTTTFVQDFIIAEHFGVSAIKDTAKRCREGWKDDVEYMAAFVTALNRLCWHHYYKGNSKLSEIYSKLFYENHHFAQRRFAKDSEKAEKYFQLTD